MLPTINEILEAAKDYESRSDLISSFRTKTHGYSLEDIYNLRMQFDEDVGELVELIQSAQSIALDNFGLQESLYEFENEAILAYGYDSYEDGTWITSAY